MKGYPERKKVRIQQVATDVKKKERVAFNGLPGEVFAKKIKDLKTPRCLQYLFDPF